ncbi:MAG: c-type cytochrome [Rhodobacteraceae bacterium]|nr:c-type cytochrome [Paracoccaceae bacterium]
MQINKLVRAATTLIILGLIAFWVLTIPGKHDPTELQGLVGSADRGALVYAASGCSSCHSAKGAEGEAMLILSGGRAFPSDFGTFFAPNISQSVEHGIGGWSFGDVANAVSFGTSPDGQHYYPAFPYTSYQNMDLADVADLYAYLKTLPASEVAGKPHDVGLPFSFRRGLGLWKLVFLPSGYHLPATGLNEEELRGRYLVEAMGHCTECHTSRNFLGGLRQNRWLAGGPNPDGKGKIPNITPHADGIGGWADIDVVTYLNSGFTPEFDVAGGQMAEVVENMKQLPAEDHRAITAYLRRIVAMPDKK